MRLILLFLILFVNILSAQTFLHGTTGIQGERVTNCLASTCSGTYLDNGGAGANYSNSITGGLYRVFCPNLPGNCVRVTFNSFNTERAFRSGAFLFGDYLTVGNGATQNSPVFTTPPTISLAGINGMLTGDLNSLTPFFFTANNPSGCLTFRFTSDGSITRSGWSASLSCVPCATPTNGPNTTDNNDCTRASELCSGVTYSSNSRGPGLVAEGCTGSTCPAGGENHTNWYFFTVLTSGTLTFTIDPQTNTDDYDFSVYGPNVTCNSLGTPIRCSDSGNTGNTGLNTTAIDNIENVTGDGFVNQMNVVVGEVYYMVVDEWLSNTGNGYDLTFGGTATLDCILFPIKLNYFGAEYRKTEKDALITWGAESDFGNEYFIVEKSQDGVSFDSIGVVDVIGTDRHDYDFIDKYPTYDGLTYYRLKWLDEQLYRYSDVAAIAVEDVVDQQIIVQPNPFMDFISVRAFGYYYGTCDVEIYNMFGQKVLEQKLQFGVTNKLEIDTKDLSPGIYNAVIKTNGNTETYKIIK